MARTVGIPAEEEVMGACLIVSMARIPEAPLEHVLAHFAARCAAVKEDELDEIEMWFASMVSVTDVEDDWRDKNDVLDDEEIPMETLLRGIGDKLYAEAEEIVKRLYDPECDYGSIEVIDIDGVSYWIAGDSTWGDTPEGIEELHLLAWLGIGDVAKVADARKNVPVIGHVRQTMGWTDQEMLQLFCRFVESRGEYGLFAAWLEENAGPKPKE
jgi:hypothetical protein